MSWRPLELCWREVCLLVGLSKPDRSKGRGLMKCNPLVLQIRGLGTGLTTLSCKTPMLRKWKNAALRATQHNGMCECVWFFDTPSVYNLLLSQLMFLCIILLVSGYIGEFEIVDDHRSGKIVVNLTGRLNKVSTVLSLYR